MAPRLFVDIRKCRICGKANFLDVFRRDAIPVTGYYAPEQAPKNLKAPIDLIFCRTCGHLQLRQTLAQDIFTHYESHTASHEEYLKELTSAITGKLGGKPSKILEIGAAQGSILKHFKELGQEEIYGIETSQSLSEMLTEEKIEAEPTRFNSNLVEKKSLKDFDCVIARQHFQMVDDLHDISASIRCIMKEGGLLVIEVPNIDIILTRRRYSNIRPQSLNYFSRAGLNNLMKLYGFSVVSENEVNIRGGSILSFFKATGEINESQPAFENTGFNYGRIRDFSTGAEDYYTLIDRKIAALNRAGKKVHGYGASSRSFVIMGCTGLNERNIPIIYDQDKNLQGKKLNGLNNQILPPEKILENKPDAIVVFALSYEDEINEYLIEKLNYRGEIITINPNRMMAPTI